MRIAIVDDTQLDAEILKQYIAQYLTQDTNRDLSIFLNSQAFYDVFQAHSYDLIFLDIFMPDISGIELAKRIRATDSDVKIVFCTTSNEFASESYSVSASYYLCKPFTKQHFAQMLKHILPQEEVNRIPIVLPDSQKIIPRDIIYTNYFNHKITIFQENSKTIETWMKQRELEELLSEYSYLQTCNRGSIINFYYVSELEHNHFVMTDGKQVSISRSMEKQVLQAYQNFLLKTSSM